MEAENTRLVSRWRQLHGGETGCLDLRRGGNLAIWGRQCDMVVASREEEERLRNEGESALVVVMVVVLAAHGCDKMVTDGGCSLRLDGAKVGGGASERRSSS
ncbi:hypothetical protein LR48_Vigan115s000400 [Vigna angularis]|uniref:Uncharacterized protein n=1 Tax=Phaseolus angularis TaxID=3914 RepID=A0A0L9T5Z6_PHAAN|nr:hypothetical protein LR48_Vigan115s000400 [Vigna angularis]